jgi:hypothetical protein
MNKIISCDSEEFKELLIKELQKVEESFDLEVFNWVKSLLVDPYEAEYINIFDQSNMEKVFVVFSEIPDNSEYLLISYVPKYELFALCLKGKKKLPSIIEFHDTFEDAINSM